MIIRPYGKGNVDRDGRGNVGRGGRRNGHASRRGRNENHRRFCRGEKSFARVVQGAGRFSGKMRLKERRASALIIQGPF